MNNEQLAMSNKQFKSGVSGFRVIAIAVLLFFAAGAAFGADFGALLDNSIEMEKDLFTYTPGLTPWFSYDNGNGMSLYLSALLSLKYINDSRPGGDSGLVKPGLIPELSRTALSYSINQGMSIEAGRIEYYDSLEFVTAGLFDGLRFNAITSAGTLTAGAFYTGLLYKETAKIILTGEDGVSYAKKWDYGKLGNYFASKRALAYVRWDMPIVDTFNISAEVLGQFDLNGKKEKLNSQYIELLANFYPISLMRITAGGVLETLQNDNGKFAIAYGGLLRLKTTLPIPLNDWLTVTGKYTSGGKYKDPSAFKPAFTPLTTVTQGIAFPGTLSGLASAGIDYYVKVIDTLAVDAAFNYFISTHDDPSNKKKLYGGEVSASVVFQPFDDLRANVGFGAFFPSMGDVYPSGTDVMWKFTAGLSIAF